jgi:hypothetical protein
MAARALDTIIVHCAATPNGRPFTAADIDRWHGERGFQRKETARLVHRPLLGHIGYHYVIGLDGTIESGRHADEVGAHAYGHNAHSIGVCLIGTDRFTRAQWNALATLLDELQDDHGPLRIIGHREVDTQGKTCPGFDVREWLELGGLLEREHLLPDPSTPETAVTTQEIKSPFASTAIQGTVGTWLTAVVAAAPTALAGDPTSIGLIVAATASMVWGVIGRYRARKAIG